MCRLTSKEKINLTTNPNWISYSKMEERVSTELESMKEVEIRVTREKRVDLPVTTTTLIRVEITRPTIAKNINFTIKTTLAPVSNTETIAIDSFYSSHIFLQSENDIFIDIVQQILTYDFSFRFSVFELGQQFLLLHMTLLGVQDLLQPEEILSGLLIQLLVNISVNIDESGHNNVFQSIYSSVSDLYFLVKS